MGGAALDVSSGRGRLVPMALDSHLALAPILRKQFGVLTVPQAESAGVSRSTLSRMAGRGELVRLYTGVYGSALYPETWQLRWMARLLAGGEGAAIGGRAAAHLWGLEHTGTRRRPPVELVVPRELRHRAKANAATRVHLREADVALTGPWRLTDVAWTLASLALRLGVARTERAVGAAMRRDQVTLERFASCVPRFRACPGVLVLREVLTRLSPELRLTRSDAEALAVSLVVAAGLPPPQVNLRVVDRAGAVRLLDLAWPEWGVCVEIDLHPDHHGTIGRNRDGARQNDLVLDWIVLRFDDLDLQFDPAHVVEVVTRTLRAAGAPV